MSAKNKLHWEADARFRAMLIALLIVISIVILFTRMRISTDLAIFLPEPTDKIEQLLHQQLDQGSTTNLVFVALSGLESKQLAELNKTIHSELEKLPIIKQISNNNKQFGEEELEFVINNRYLLTHNDLEQQFSLDGLSESLEDRLENLASSTSILEKRFLARDPTGEVLSLLDEWQGKLQSASIVPHEKHGVWFSADGTRSLLLIELNIQGANLNKQTTAIKSIYDIFDQHNQGAASILLTGPAVFTVETNNKILNDVKLLTIIAVTLVILFLLAVYRSLIMLILVILPLLLGVLLATATVLLGYNKIHGITLTFGITLAGVAIDYPIHLMTGMVHYQGDRMQKVIEIWPTLRLGVISTALAYGAFVASGFGGLQQLGVFTVVGLIAAAAISRWILPSLVPEKSKPVQGLQALHHFLTGMGRAAPRLRWLVPSLIVVTVAGLTITDRPIRDLNVDSLSPIDKKRRADDRLLRKDLGFWAGGQMLAIMADDDEQVLQISEQLHEQLNTLIEENVIQGFNMASQFLPSKSLQRFRQTQLPENKALQQRFDEAVEGLPFKKSVFQPFFEQVDASRTLPLIDMRTLAASPVGEKLEPLLTDSGGESVGIVLLHGVSDQQAMEAFIKSQKSEMYYIHLKQASTRLVQRSVNRVSLIMLVSMFLIYLVMTWSFGSLRRPLRVMVPPLAAAIVVTGILVASGMSLNVFHLIALLLVIGLGLDYALFFNRLPDNQTEWDTTFRSLWICSITTILVFGILMFSDIPPLSAIGTTVAIGATLSMIFSAMWANVGERRENASDKQKVTVE